MIEDSRLYRHPLLLAAGYAALLVPLVSLALLAAQPGLAWLALALLLIFGALFGVFRWGEESRYGPRPALLYLTAQTALTAAMLAASPQTSELLILFNILVVQVTLLMPARAAAVWVLVFVGLTGLYVISRIGWGGALAWFGQSSGYAAFAVVGGALRQADLARRRSQALLTELQAAHRQLQDYAAQSQQLAILQERNRLARDLHDSVKQQAFALAAQLGAARTLLRPDPAAAEARLVEAELISDSLRQELAGLILEWRLPAVAALGLPAALQEYALDWSRQSGIPLAVRLAGECRLPAPAQQALFRIAQEALANVARHSRASQATLTLDCSGDTAVLSLADDGVGFDTGRVVPGGNGFDPSQAEPGGMGLASMRERAEALGGALALVSAPGSGTRVEVRLKCQ